MEQRGIGYSRRSEKNGTWSKQLTGRDIVRSVRIIHGEEQWIGRDSGRSKRKVSGQEQCSGRDIQRLEKNGTCS